MSRHYDLAANEAQMRRDAEENNAAAMARATDGESLFFVEVQRRLLDVAILPRLEAMRAWNEERSGEEVVAAFAVKVALALHNIADILDVDPTNIWDAFQETLLETAEALDHEDYSDGFSVCSSDIMLQVGKA